MLFLIEKRYKKFKFSAVFFSFSAVFFSSVLFVFKTPDTDPDSLVILGPYSDPDSINPDPQL